VPFRALNERHAIHEVVFVVTFQKAFESGQVGAVMAAHEGWRELLPNMNPLMLQALAIGPKANPVLRDQGIRGVSFERLKQDGSLQWRLLLQENFTAVNCLSYTRWVDIWPEARRLLDATATLLVKAQQPVVGVALQYIDDFIWDGPQEEYSIDQLIRQNSTYVPNSVRGKGPLWHLHQGWFDEAKFPHDGRLLERTHVDSTRQDKTGTIQTRIDMTLRLDFREPIQSRDALFGGERPKVEEIFSRLHTLNKDTLRAYITDEMAEKIELNG